MLETRAESPLLPMMLPQSMMWSTILSGLAVISPSFATNAPLPPQPLVAFQASPTPDANGVYSFEAQAGDILSINRQHNSLEMICYPELVSGGSSSLLGDSLRLTPFSETLLIQINTSGRYQYRITTLTADDRIGALSTLGNPETTASATPEGYACEVTVQRATAYEQQWLAAQQAEQDNYLDQALDLYTAVIAAAPTLPEPYKSRIRVLMSLHADHLVAEPQDPETIGQRYLALPASARQSLIADFRQLADIYATEPTWQVEVTDQPEFLRGFATYIETGIAPDSVRQVLWGE